MSGKLPSVAFVVLLLATPLATAQGILESQSLKGSVFFREDNCDNENSKQRCNLSFTIEGKAARMIYDNMASKAVKDECTEGLVKSEKSGMRCFKQGNEYSCDFGYRLKAKSFGNSDVTC